MDIELLLQKLKLETKNVELNIQKLKLETKNVEFNIQKIKLEKQHIKFKRIQPNVKNKGSNCSKSGKKYEIQVHNIVSKCFLNSKKFNTQSIKDLGGSSSKNDIECNFDEYKDIPIEIKIKNTPDWMQLSIEFNKDEKYWKARNNNRTKIPQKSKDLIENFIQDKTIFNNKMPPTNLMHDEWIKFKKESKDFNDQYFDCTEDTIAKLYAAKGCKYIQISEKGLYYLETDFCNFGVPRFICPQQFRVRTKIHSSGRKTNTPCTNSVTIACKPKKISDLPNSPFSLDNMGRLPKNLIYNLERESET